MINGKVINVLQVIYPNLKIQANEQLMLEKIMTDDAFEILAKIQSIPEDYLKSIMKIIPIEINFLLVQF